MESLQIGQVLWLKVRYQIDKVATTTHPMLIAKIESNYIEIIAIDKTAGKMQQLYHEYNCYIDCNNPKEKVIYEDSYAQLNTKLTIAKFPELVKARKIKETLSKQKLNDILCEYKDFQDKNDLDESRIVHMAQEELILMNSFLKN